MVAHADNVCLKNPKTKISQSGKQRAIETGIRNVHAFIVGYVVDDRHGCETRLRYNPFSDKGFYTEEGLLVEDATFVEFNESGAFI